MKYFAVLSTLVVLLTITIDYSQYTVASNHKACPSTECNETSCLNGGNCTVFRGFWRSAKYCVCAPEWTGAQCEQVNFCRNVNCSCNGVCMNKESSYECQCFRGYNGTNCENKIPGMHSWWSWMCWW